jgi:hypothetical protein
VSLLTIPNTFVTGTTIAAAPFNANFSTVATAVNNIDNTNIGVAGLFASNLLPTSPAQATFGGAVGYTFSPGAAGQVPLTVNGATAQTADLFDVFLTPAGIKAFSVSASGTTAVSGLVSSTAAGLFLEAQGATTGNSFAEVTNTGNTTYLGVESSVGGTIFFGTSAYATVLGTFSARSLQFATNNVVVQTITSAGATTFSGNVGIAGNLGAASVNVTNLIVAATSTTGAIQIGGGSTNAVLDFGITTASRLTVSGVTQFSNQIIPGNAFPGTSAIYGGTGIPSFSAPGGSIFLRYDGAINARLYVNQASSTSNTSWIPVNGV